MEPFRRLVALTWLQVRTKPRRSCDNSSDNDNNNNHDDNDNNDNINAMIIMMMIIVINAIIIVIVILLSPDLFCSGGVLFLFTDTGMTFDAETMHAN